MITCPRCYGNPSVVCCALCQDEREVSEDLAQQYKALKSKSIDATIALRESAREQAMRLIRQRIDVLEENEFYIVALCVFKDGRSAVLSANKHTGEASFVTPGTGLPFCNAQPA